MPHLRRAAAKVGLRAKLEPPHLKNVASRPTGDGWPLSGVEPFMSADPQLPVTSSIEPEWASDARDFYRDVLVSLDNLPWAVGGALALQWHTGIWRATKDLDLLLSPQAVPDALRQLRAQGFHTCIEDSVWLAKVIRDDYFVDLITGISNACLIVDDSWFRRAVPGEILGIPCRILAAEELIASKVFVTRRERFDGSDVVQLLRACGPQLDWDRLMQLLDPHWQLLYWSLVLFAYIYPAHTDLVPSAVWQQLNNRFRDEVQQPHRNQAFRGSLVDPRMFAINVNEWGERNLYEEYRQQHPCLLQSAEDPGKETNR